MPSVQLRYNHRPMLLPLYIGGAMLRRRGLVPGEQLPAMRSVWSGMWINIEHLKAFNRLCGNNDSLDMPFLYPLSLLFPLHMTIIFHPVFPLTYVTMFQIRNHVVQHRQIHIHEQMDLACEILNQRAAAKGLEMDVHSTIVIDGQVVWESLHPHFFPGRYGAMEQPSPLADFQVMPTNVERATWTMPTRGGCRFGLLSGDYNGIHLYAPYARRRGFRRDFAHAQRTLAYCLGHLPYNHGDMPQRLDAALKGPAYYGSPIVMDYVRQPTLWRFATYCDNDPRPCLKGALYHGVHDFKPLAVSGLTLHSGDLESGDGAT
jgi:hypothetical protein